MTLTPMGWLLVPLSVFLFARGPRALFWATLVAAPFTAVRVVLAPGFSALGTPFVYFGALLVSRVLLDGFLRGRFNLRMPPAGFLLLAFLGLCILSAFMPAFIRGRVDVVSMDTAYQDYHWEPLWFSRNNLTQLVYPMFMAGVFLVLYAQMRTLSEIWRAARLIVSLAVVVLLSGLFYQAASVARWFVMRDGVFEFFLGYNVRHMDRGFGLVPRMFSLAGEAGFTAAYLTMAVGIAAFQAAGSAPGERSASRRTTYFLLLGLILTGGTTGFVGLVLLMGTLLLMWLWTHAVEDVRNGFAARRAALQVWGAALAGVIAAVVSLQLVLGINLYNWLFRAHLGKLMAASAVQGSGAFRLESTVAALEVFAQFPWLGVGYGSHRTTSLISSLLSNVGALGTLAFLAFNSVVAFSCLGILRHSRDGRVRILAGGLVAGFISFFGSALIGKGMETLLFGFYWVLLAMMAALVSLERDVPRAATAQ